MSHVSPLLNTIYNELSKMYEELKTLQNKGGATMTEVNQYIEELNRIEAQRKDGIFPGDASDPIPAGQVRGKTKFETSLN
jgi:hypothetical protein